MAEPASVPKPDLHGSINHVSITVSDLPEAMKFFGPLLKFLGYTVGEIFDDNRTGGRLTFNINESNGTAFNIWQAKPELAAHRFEVYEPGLHHVAFNVQRHEQVDEAFELVRSLGAAILDGPGEFPFGPGGYYALYFLGPDRLKFEIVHMPLAERNYRQMLDALERGSR
jgi:catechol 2,3-dioxygenase-like lactoylglutathione lyase family enzyme